MCVRIQSELSTSRVACEVSRYGLRSKGTHEVQGQPQGIEEWASMRVESNSSRREVLVRRAHGMVMWVFSWAALAWYWWATHREVVPTCSLSRRPMLDYLECWFREVRKEKAERFAE